MREDSALLGMGIQSADRNARRLEPQELKTLMSQLKGAQNTLHVRLTGLAKRLVSGHVHHYRQQGGIRQSLDDDLGSQCQPDRLW